MKAVGHGARLSRRLGNNGAGQMKLTTSQSKQGFTLIELMVVLGIMLLLVALLVPVGRNAIESGRQAACRSNLRQIGTAFFLFATENNGWLPIVDVDLSRPIAGGDHLTGQWPFTQHLVMLAEQGYIRDPRKFWCPSDHINGPGLNIEVFPASSFDSDFNSFQNVSYMYVAGYNLRSWRGDFSRSPVLADESNQMERGDLTPGAMPNFTEHDNHGANYRNVLWLDGSVSGVEHEDVGNVIFEGIPPELTAFLNSID